MGGEDPLMVSISGIRGISNSSLNARTVEKYVGAFLRLLRTEPQQKLGEDGTGGRRILVLGRDSRISGPWIARLVQGLAMASGLEVIDFGVVPTPSVQYLVLANKALGGVIVTASHNPEPWNGLKFVDSDGLFVSPERCAKIFAYAKQDPEVLPYDLVGKLDESGDGPVQHVQAILRLPELDPAKVQAAKLRVCLDAINGAGGRTMMYLLQQLGVDAIGINLEPSGRFAHPPEPIPEHLGQLGEAVREHKADLGIAVDPDVDRCVFLDGDGIPIGEEYTLALATKFWLGKCGKRGIVCKNLSSSRAVDDVASKYGCKVECAPVGEIHVAMKMVQCGAVIGGEGNGGVMLPDVHIGRDAPVAAALVLSYLARYVMKDRENRTLRSLVDRMPQWRIVKMKTNISPAFDRALSDLQSNWEKDPSYRLDTQDGLRVDTPEYWLHIRKSNTEPIARVICEAANIELATEICSRHLALLQ